MEAIDGNCINDATHTKISEKASTSGAEVGHRVGRMMTFSVAMVFGWIDLVRILSILLIFGASVPRLLARDALFFLSL